MSSTKAPVAGTEDVSRETPVRRCETCPHCAPAPIPGFVMCLLDPLTRTCSDPDAEADAVRELRAASEPWRQDDDARWGL